MEVSFRLIRRATFITELEVSILVLMEVSFRRLGALSPGIKAKRFNPCFNGSIFQTEN